MKTIKVLGSGCRNCQVTYERIEQVAREKGVEVRLEKIEEIGEIMGYGVMSTPGVVVDEVVVHSGGIPDRNTIADWLE